MDINDVKRAKLACGKTFKDLADELGERPGDVMLMIAGTKKPTKKLLRAIGLEHKEKSREPEEEPSSDEESVAETE